MRLLDPAALALAALLPALVLLYFLKLRRRRLAVPSLRLWRAVVSDPRANSLFERLRRRALLLLQILILLGLVLAAARPYLPLGGLPGRTVVVVLDRSLSMQTIEHDGRSRFEAARARIRELIEHLGRDEQLLLLAAGPEPMVVTGFSSDGERLLAALAELRPSDAPADLGSALATAQAITRGRPGAGILVLSDLAGERLPERLPATALACEVLGHREDNLAITLLAVRTRPSSSFDREGVVGVRNLGDLPARIRLELDVGGVRLLATDLEVEARGRSLETFSLPARLDGVLEARIAPGGAVASDDVARALLAPARRRRVAVLGGSDPWLERALAVDRELEIVRDGDADATVWLKRQPPLPLAGPALLLDPPPGEQALIPVGAAAQDPLVSDFRRDHPVLAWVDLGAVVMGGARRLGVPPGASVLAETAAGPLLVAGESAGGRWLALGLDPAESDWPLRVGWPIFVHNALRWLIAEELLPRPLLAGESRLVAVAREAGSTLTLVSPSGSRRRLPPADGPVALGRLDQAGMWRIEGGRTVLEVAVNAGSEQASRIAPGRAPVTAPVPPGAGGEEAGAVLTGRDLSSWVLLAMLALLGLEWWAWHRRTLG